MNPGCEQMNAFGQNPSSLEETDILCCETLRTIYVLLTQLMHWALYFFSPSAAWPYRQRYMIAKR